ncbi:MAG TPA: hypothetical protein PLS56_00305 [Candidatus Dojkabacteria bacterium]|jgi:hypothetical protein|nr:hypothetical protein [Candidatus Dojkabacteria bacterium]
MKNLSKYIFIVSLVCVLPMAVFAQTDSGVSVSSSESSFTTTSDDTSTSNTNDANTTQSTTQTTDATTQTDGTTAETTTTPVTTTTTTTTTSKSTKSTSSSYMDYLPYVLIVGSVILLVSIIGILISSKKKGGAQELVQVTPQPTSAPEDINSAPNNDSNNQAVSTPQTQTEETKPTLADIVNQTTVPSSMDTQQTIPQSGNDMQSSVQPNFTIGQTASTPVQTQTENQPYPYQTQQQEQTQQPFSSNIDMTQPVQPVAQNPVQAQNYGASDINTFQNNNTLSFGQPTLDQSVASDFLSPDNSSQFPQQPQPMQTEPAVTIPDTTGEIPAQDDFQNMINSEISKIPQQPAGQPIQPKIDETPSGELPQVPPTM